MRLQRIGQGFDPPPLHGLHLVFIHPRPVVAMRLSASLLGQRVTMLAAGLVLLAGCGGGAVSPEKARTQPVVQLLGGSLSGEVLDRWLVASKEAPTRAEATGMVSAWMNDALLIDAIRRNKALDDPATFDTVIMETAARTAVAKFFLARDSQYTPVTDRQIDSTLDADQARVFQQILLRVKGKPDSASIAALNARALALHDQLVKGGDFSAAVKTQSDDSASRSKGGYLAPVTAAQMGDRLAAVFNLAPGAISPVMRSPVAPAMVIVRRATRQEARQTVKTWLGPLFARRADSLFVDSVAKASHIVIPPDARIRARTMAHEPVTLVDGPPFATWKDGGKLSAATVRNATLALPPVDRYSLTDAPDTMVSQYLIQLARREILLPMVVKEPLPTAAVRASYLPAYRHVLDSLRAIVGRLPANLSRARCGDSAARFSARTTGAVPTASGRTDGRASRAHAGDGQRWDAGCGGAWGAAALAAGTSGRHDGGATWRRRSEAALGLAFDSSSSRYSEQLPQPTPFGLGIRMAWRQARPSVGPMSDPENVEHQHQLARQHRERAGDRDRALLRQDHVGAAGRSIRPAVNLQVHDVVTPLERPFVHARRILENNRGAFGAFEQRRGGACEIAERIGLVGSLHGDAQVVGLERNNGTARSGQGKTQ